ncbi:MAG: hypothetical protein V3R89_03865 [Thermoanaerobaculia bacterium]
MKRRIRLSAMLLIVVALAHPAAGAAQELYTFTVSLLGGIGGSLDVDEGGFGNTSFQLGFSALTDQRIHFAARLGEIDFGSQKLETLTDVSLTYLTLGGEYHTAESFYESAVFLGIGAYNLEATRIEVGSVDETSFGGFVGVLGDFEISPKWVFRIEGAVHYVDVEKVVLFATVQGGVVYRF